MTKIDVFTEREDFAQFVALATTYTKEPTLITSVGTNRGSTTESRIEVIVTANIGHQTEAPFDVSYNEWFIGAEPDEAAINVLHPISKMFGSYLYSIKYQAKKLLVTDNARDWHTDEFLQAQRLRSPAPGSMERSDAEELCTFLHIPQRNLGFIGDEESVPSSSYSTSDLQHLITHRKDLKIPQGVALAAIVYIHEKRNPPPIDPA